MDISPGLQIKLYWRILPLCSSQQNNNSFTSFETISASASPYLEGKGILEGKNILSLIKNLTIKNQISNIQFLSFPDGTAPEKATSKMALLENSTYNQYITLDIDKCPALYIDISTTELFIDEGESISIFSRKTETTNLWQAEGKGDYELYNTISAKPSPYGKGCILGYQLFEIFSGNKIDALKIKNPQTNKSCSGYLDVFNHQNNLYNEFITVYLEKKSLLIDLISIKE